MDVACLNIVISRGEEYVELLMAEQRGLDERMKTYSRESHLLLSFMAEKMAS